MVNEIIIYRTRIYVYTVQHINDDIMIDSLKVLRAFYFVSCAPLAKINGQEINASMSLYHSKKCMRNQMTANVRLPNLRTACLQQQQKNNRCYFIFQVLLYNMSEQPKQL